MTHKQALVVSHAGSSGKFLVLYLNCLFVKGMKILKYLIPTATLIKLHDLITNPGVFAKVEADLVKQLATQKTDWTYGHNPHNVIRPSTKQVDTTRKQASRKQAAAHMYDIVIILLISEIITMVYIISAIFPNSRPTAS